MAEDDLGDGPLGMRVRELAAALSEGMQALMAQAGQQRALIEAQQATITALACALHEARVLDLAAVSTAFKAVRLNTVVMAAPDAATDVAGALQLVEERLAALASPGQAGAGTSLSPTQMLLMEAAMVLQAPPHLRNAQASWMSQATPEELQQEIAQLLAGLRKR